MNSKKDILSQINRRDGFSVPDGYFEDFEARMLASLPEKSSADVIAPRSLWQRIRPYAYMAAMFAGVWCMLKVVSMMSASVGTPPLETNPIIAEAFSNETFVNDYVLDDLNQWDLYDEMMDDGVDAEALTDSLLQTINFE